jgi:precorrin-2 dehydrogenase/sirohydrochlorin ferrochelatase
MGYYPVFLDIAGKPVVVIGGGQVALRKAASLLEAGAQVTVVSPALHPDLEALVAAGRVGHISREYTSGDLEGHVLAIVCTDNRSLNAAVAREGRRRGVWVNAVDDPANCDFIMPSIVRRGDIIVAVSTSAASPAMARKLREDLEEFLSEEYALMLDLVAEVRRELRERGVSVGPDVWNAALDGEVKRLLGQGNLDGAKQRLLRSLLEPARET